MTGAGVSACSCASRMRRAPDDTCYEKHRISAKSPLQRGAAFSRHRHGDGPFVYRLGRQVFNLERGVRFPYGLPPKYITICFYFIILSPTQVARPSIALVQCGDCATENAPTSRHRHHHPSSTRRSRSRRRAAPRRRQPRRASRSSESQASRSSQYHHAPHPQAPSPAPRATMPRSRPCRRTLVTRI